MLTVSGASNMTSDDEFLLFAHNDGSISSWSSTGSAYNTQKIARQWRLDETGNVGTVDFTLNENNLPALPANTKYGLMIDADGDFTDGAKVYEMAVSGSDYKVNAVDVTDGDYICIVAIDPTIFFKPVLGSAVESANASATITLNYKPTSAVNVDYATSNGSATAGSDYTAIAATTLNFSAGTISQTISVTVNDDGVAENHEEFYINLTNASADLTIGDDDTYTHKINDNDNTRKIEFTTSTSSGSESSTSVNIEVKINTSDAGNATTVDYEVIGGTATGSGTDYTLASGTATIAAGNTTTNINISINNDALDEVNETIIIELDDPSNADLGTTLQHTYTINDDDDEPTVYFTTTSSSGSETVSSKTIEVKISAVSTKNVSVSFAATGTATSGTDYSIGTSSPITITAGNTTADISLTITDDVLQESNETVILTLSAPTNATVGGNNPYTYTILDDETMGYVGPGGVGASATLMLWLKAENIPGSSNGDRISSWADQSGNSNSLSSSGDARPHYYANQANGYDVVRFGEIANTRLVKTSFTDFPTSEITIYTVRNTSINNFGEYSYATSTSASGNELLAYNSSTIRIYRNNSAQNTNISIPDGWNIFGTLWSTDDLNIYLNGEIKYNNSSSSNTNIIAGGCLAIGAEQDALNGDWHATDDFEGDFAEVLIYNKFLNKARNIIINNYLSAKYNIPMDLNDKYAGDNPAKGDYDFEVIGIGQSTNGPHNEARGSGGIWLKQVSNFGNGDYLLIGHSEVEPQIYTPAEDAGLSDQSIDQRWGRDWYFDITDGGSAITVNLTFDFDEAGMNSANSPAGNASDYKLLYRSGTSGNWSVVSSASSINASQVLFTGQGFANGDGYYALGTTDEDASPLPIELMSFVANRNNKDVVLKWETASETNNDYFEIQHSYNSKEWNTIGIVDGSGTTNTIKKYSLIDRDVSNTINYYRLKQTDFDGKYSFSQIRSVGITNEQEINIYPNPSKGIVYISNLNSGSIIKIYDMNSRLIELSIIYETESAKIDMQELPKSVYFIKIISEDDIKTYKLIKN